MLILLNDAVLIIGVICVCKPVENGGAFHTFVVHDVGHVIGLLATAQNGDFVHSPVEGEDMSHRLKVRHDRRPPCRRNSQL